MTQKPTYEELERKVQGLQQAEEALRESEEKYRSLLDSIEEIYFEVDLAGNFTFFNNALTKSLGYSNDELMGMGNRNFMPRESSKEIYKLFNQIHRTGHPIKGVVYEIIRKDGSRGFHELSASLMRDQSGEAIGFRGIAHDVTKRNRAEEALRESDEKYRNLAENPFVGIFRTALDDGTFLYSNQKNAEIIGYDSPKDLIGRVRAANFYPSEAREELLDILRREGKVEDFETELVLEDGTKKNISISAQLWAEKDYLEGVIIDITDRKRAEKAEFEAMARFSRFGEASQYGMGMADLDGRIIYVNPALARMLGEKSADVCLGKHFPTAYYSESITRKLQEEVLPAIMRDGHWHGELELQTVDGRRMPTDENYFVIRDEHGQPCYLADILTDITERKKAEEALRESEEKYRSILENIEDGYYETDIAGNYTFFNDSLCRIFGYPGDELLGVSYKKTTDKETADMVYQVFNKVHMTREPIKGLQYMIFRKDGSKRYIEVSASLRLNSKGQPIGFQGITRDVTERKLAEDDRKKLEDQLQRAQKMEALGLLAGGVAHDLNNILSGIVSYPELLLMDLPEDSPFRNPIQTIQESGMRAAQVVADLLTIARGVAIGKEILNLNTVVSEYLDSVEYQKLEKTRSLVEFKSKLDPDLLNISSSPIHLKKALMNLVNNAAEAIEGSGTVTISTSNRYLDEPLKGCEDVRTGEYAVLSVSDDGSGISQQDLARIFEPFYTKKVMGKSGTGLGLAVVWNTVQDHKGYINVESGEKGTIFELYFPVTREEVSVKKEPVHLADYMGHGEKILVVDDEERQREIACKILTKLGYAAEAVSGGEEAVAYIKEHRVVLIVLDMVMPKGMNGRETYEEIIKIRPGQKAVIASGYAKTKEVDIIQKLGAGKYIRKPYTLEKIGVAVKEELEK